MTLRLVSVGEGTDLGLVRVRNEDALRSNLRAGVLVVADGMGGHAGGSIASSITVEIVEASVAGHRLPLTQALVHANEAVLEAARSGRGHPGMGSTCVVCRVNGSALEYGWIGDSRLYLGRNGSVEQLSRDHSYVQTLVDAGTITSEQASRHPERNVLTYCVGSGRLVATDVGEGRAELLPGDRILLCSDGLTGELDDARIGEILAGEDHDERAVRALIEGALDAGGHDNVTVIVATVGE